MGIHLPCIDYPISRGRTLSKWVGKGESRSLPETIKKTSRSGGVFCLPLNRPEYISLISHRLLNARPDLIPLLVHWIEWKIAFKNSVISNYSPSRVKKLSRVNGSYNTIDKRVKLFIKEGLARIENGNLILTSKVDLTSQNSCETKEKYQFVKLNPNQNLKDQLYAVLVNTKINQARHKIAISQFKGKPNSSALKLVKSKTGAIPLRMSVKKLGEFFKTSQSSAFRIIQRLCMSGLLQKIKRKIECLGRLPKSDFKAMTEYGFIFVHKGLVFLSPSNAYTQLQ